MLLLQISEGAVSDLQDSVWAECCTSSEFLLKGPEAVDRLSLPTRFENRKPKEGLENVEDEEEAVLLWVTTSGISPGWHLL